MKILKITQKASKYLPTYIYIPVFILFINIIVSCQNDKNATEFDRIITRNIQKDSTVNFAEIFPFDWDKMYVFNRDHYPEARAKTIAKITGTGYRGGHNYNDRLILFVKDHDIVYEVINKYHSDDFDKDIAPFQYNFRTGKHIPDYFTPENAVFQLKKYRNAYWLWQDYPHKKKQPKNKKESSTLNSSINLLINTLKKAKQIARKHLKDKYFDTIYDSEEFDVFKTRIIIGKIFSKQHKHLVIKRLLNGLEKINVYSIEKNKTIRLVKEMECGYLSFEKDSIFDVNGDGLKDLTLTWYPTSGCCLAHNYIVALYDEENNSFSKDFHFLNPTFFPDEKIIRGFTYGQPAEVTLYKFQWDKHQIDTIEFIGHYKNQKNKYIKSTKKKYHYTPEDGKILTKIPEEYHKIKDFNWVTGNIKYQ